ncbi:MAG: hypothetical protein KJ072_26170 [Verrucomicrobia bacterium]|nr:hypothetical protein [Verrucomicrobiota bacterium]
MNAEPLLSSVVAALAVVKLEAILIGNAAAALHGAPVTTVDFDCMFRTTPANLAKLRRFAQQMDAQVFRPRDRALVDLIRRRLAMSVSQRMNFLRVRVPGGGSHL